MANTRIARRYSRRLQRGQSLVEVALSLTVLLLVFSGAVDLGRAFFTKVYLDSAVSEGAHVAAAWPGCLKYGTKNFMGTDNVPRQCWSTNNAYWRALRESNQLDSTRFVDIAEPVGYTPTDLATCSGTSGPNRCASDLTDIVPGDMVYITLQYRMALITPIMRGMFGNDLTLSSTTKLVVRGSGIPETYGEAQPQPPNINPVKVIKDGRQKYGDGICTSGLPTLEWKSSEVVRGFNIYPATSQVSNPTFSTTAATPADLNENTDATGLVPESAQQTYAVQTASDSYGTFYDTSSLMSGGIRKFIVRAWVKDATNGTVFEGPDYTITAECKPVKPVTFTAACRVDNQGLDVSWQMENDSLLDRAVDSFGIYRSPSSFVGAVSGHDTRVGSVLFNTASPGDWLSNSYYVQARIGTQAVGQTKSFPGVNCSYATTADVSITDGISSITAGSPADYTIVVKNTGAVTAYGVEVVQSTTLLTNQQWTCGSATNGAQCNAISGGSGQLNTSVMLPSNASLTFHITGFYPSTPQTFTTSVTVKGTTGCAANCSVTVTGTTSKQTTLTAGTNVDLSISHIPNTVSTLYTPPTAISYDLIVQNTTTGVNANPVRVTINVPTPMNPMQTTWRCTTYSGSATCPQAGPVTFSANQITISGFNLPGNSAVKLTISTTPPSSARVNFTTEAVVQPDSGSGVTDTSQSNNSVTHEYVYSSGTISADLGLLLSGSSTYISGTTSLLAYTVYAYNRGPDDITKATITVDDLNDQLHSIAGTSSISFACTTSGNASCGSGGTGTGTYDSATRKFIISDVALGANSSYTPPVSTSTSPLPGNYVKYTITITTPTSLAGNVQLTSTITSVEPSGAVDAVTPGLNRVTFTTVESSSIIADMAIAISAYSGNPYSPGSDITYTVTVSNTSKNNVTNASVIWSDLNNAFDSTAWCQGAGCTPTSSLPISGLVIARRSNLVLQVKGHVSASYNTATGFTVQGQVTGSIDNIQSNNTAQAVVNAATLDLYTQANSHSSTEYLISYKPGETHTIKIKVGNNKSSKVYGAYFSNMFTPSDKFTTVTWTCTAYGDSSCAGGSVGTGVPTNVQLNLGSTDSGSYVEFAITVTMKSDASGTISSTGSISAPGSLSDDTLGNNSSAVFTMKFGENLAMDWVVTPSATTYQPGDTLTYYFTVTNKGDNSVNATIWDTFTGSIVQSASWTKCSDSSDTTCSITGGTNNVVDTSTSMNPKPTITLASLASVKIKVVLKVKSGTTDSIATLNYYAEVAGPTGYAEITALDNKLSTSTMTRYWPAVSNFKVSLCDIHGNSSTQPLYEASWTFDNYKITNISTPPTKIVVTSGTTTWSVTTVLSAANTNSTGFYVPTAGTTWTLRIRDTVPYSFINQNFSITLYAGSSSTIQMGSSTSIKLTPCS